MLETADSLVILFSQQVGIVLQRQPGKFQSGILRLWVGQQAVLSMPAGYTLPPELVIVSKDSLPGISDWRGYLLQRQANNWQWPPVGGREMEVQPLDPAEYLGYQISGDTVFIKTRVSAFGQTGELEWLFLPVERRIGQTAYHGIGWQVRLHGLESAAWLNIVEPIQTRSGDWVLAQTWGRWIENQVGGGEPFVLEQKWYFADMQPFYFAGGGQGATLSFFNHVVASLVEMGEEAGRHFILSHIPLGMGANRQTPLKLWLRTEKDLPSKWVVLLCTFSAGRKLSTWQRDTRLWKSANLKKAACRENCSLLHLEKYNYPVLINLRSLLLKTDVIIP